MLVLVRFITHIKYYCGQSEYQTVCSINCPKDYIDLLEN